MTREEDEFWEVEYLHQAYIQNMRRAQKSKLKGENMKEEQDTPSVIPLLLRQYADFFSSDDHELFDDEETQYELLWNLIMERGELICELEWDSGGMMYGQSWMRKIGDYYFIYDEVEPLYGPFDSLDAALENCNTCRYISDAVTSIYIKKPVDTIDWIITADDNHTLVINSEEYVVQNGSLLKEVSSTENREESQDICSEEDKKNDEYNSGLPEEEAQKLPSLIEKFNNDPEYRRDIMLKGNSMLIKGETSKSQTAEEYLAMMALQSRY